MVICLGGLLDSNLPIKLQMWLFDKSPIRANTVINDIPPDIACRNRTRLSAATRGCRKDSMCRTAILNQPDGSLIQDLPFSIELNKFIVDYYSTGMPKLFASDIVVVDHKTGARVPARVEVNKPFTYDGVSIFQSSFQDGGSQTRDDRLADVGSNRQDRPVRRRDRRECADGAGRRSPTVNRGFTISARSTSKTSRTATAGDARGVAHRTLRRLSTNASARAQRPRTRLDLRNVGPRCNTRCATRTARRAIQQLHAAGGGGRRTDVPRGHAR